MSDDVSQTNSGGEPQLNENSKPDVESASVDEKSQIQNSDEAQASGEETKSDIPQMFGQSQVYNATTETLFSSKTRHTKPHVLVRMFKIFIQKRLLNTQILCMHINLPHVQSLDFQTSVFQDKKMFS